MGIEFIEFIECPECEGFGSDFFKLSFKEKLWKEITSCEYCLGKGISPISLSEFEDDVLVR